ncbi:MAG: GNAT family N-acetyltransferase [Myxococcota bacterium]
MHRSAAALDQPDSFWNQAAGRSPQGDAFCCRTEWQLSLQEAFFPRRRLVFRRNETSLLALAERRYPDLGRILEPLDSLWMFGSPLLGPEALELLEALLAERRAAGEPATALVSGVLPDGPLRAALLRGFGPGFEIFRVKTVKVCCASLEGGLDGFLARRSRTLRKRLRQASRHAASHGLRFERVAPRSAAEADAAFARMLAVELQSWKGLAGRGMEEPTSSAFYAAMARRLAVSGSGRVIFARLDERDVGFIFGGLAGPIYRGQQFSYAEDHADWSIGNLLQQAQVAWLAEEGVVQYDLGPWMAYKDHWAERTVPMEVLLLRPRPARARPA